MIRTTFLEKTQFRGVELYCAGIALLGQRVKPVYFFKIKDLLIDTGPSLVYKKVLRDLTNQQLSRIILTHTHEDHSGNAAMLSSTLKLPVSSHPAAIPVMSQGFSILPYQKLMFGNAKKLNMTPVESEIVVDGHILQVIPTPGHADDHIALFEPNEGWLFSGDLYVGEKIKYFRKGEKMLQQIQSLRKLVSLDFEVLFCSHNPQLQGGKNKLVKKLQHFEALYEAIVYHHSRGLSNTEIMKQVAIKREFTIELFTFNDVSARHLVSSVTDYL